MAQAVTERQLTEAVAHVALGERTIARQRRMIARLESDGRDSTTARELLAKFEDAQAMHVADRDRLVGERAGFEGASGPFGRRSDPAVRDG
jgi:hypothetical protein